MYAHMYLCILRQGLMDPRLFLELSIEQKITLNSVHFASTSWELGSQAFTTTPGLWSMEFDPRTLKRVR